MNKRIFTVLNLLIYLTLFFLPALIIVTGYNVTGVMSAISVDNPTQTITNDKITISTVLRVRNPGPLPLEAELQASINGDHGTQVRMVSPKLSIPADLQLKIVPINLEVDLTQITNEDMMRLGISPENITITVTAHVSLTPLVSLGADASAHVDWLPILYNLTVGTPILTEINPIRLAFEVPISFENQSPFFGVNGVGVLRLYNSSTQVSESSLHVIADPTSKWSGSAQFVVPPPSDPSSFILEDKTLTYRVASEFTFTNYPVTLKGPEKNVILEWGALIKNPKTTTTYTPVNSTHTRVQGTLTYHNNNHLITLDAAVTPKLVNAQGDAYLGKTQQVHVPPGAASSLTLEIVAPNSQLVGGGLKLELGIESPLGSFNVEVNLLG